MRVVVTGGGGYLGSWVVRELLARGHEAVVFDRFCFGEEAVQELRGDPRCRIVRGDVRHLRACSGLLDGAEGVIHLAGLANDPSCDLDPEMTLEVNVAATRALADRAVREGVRRFVFASSCSVYGHGVFETLDEQSPLNPVSTYAQSKVDGEKILFDLRSETFEPTATRFATLFGLSPRMRFDLAVNQMTATAVRDKVINIYGGGKQWRPFLHVHDAALALIALLEAPAEKVSGAVFNVGSDAANLQIAELANRVHALIPDVEIKVFQDDDDRRTYNVQFQKITNELGFECERGIEDGIREIRAWLEAELVNPFDEQFFNVRRMKTLLATPVSEGGEPVAPRFIPLASPVFDEAEEKAVVDTLRSGWITSGPCVPQFERELAEVVGAQHAIAAISCTAALHLCLAHYGVGPGDDVLLSPITWASVGNTVLNMGANVVFADVDPGTLNVTPETVERAITPRTKVVMPVHMAGQACDIEGIRAVAAKHGAVVVEDAAHALGSAYHGKPVGSGDGPACFSFYAIKNITTIEGGAVTTDDEEVAAHLRQLAGNGMTASAWQRYTKDAAPGPPEVIEPGYKYAMGNVAAAIGLEQLKKLPQFLASRQRLARLYRHALADVEEARMLNVDDTDAHAWHLMIVRLQLDRLTKSRNEIAQAMREENIGIGYHFYGLHLHEYYERELGWKPDDLPNATGASHEVMSLPLYPAMSEKNVQDVVAALKKVIAHAKKA